MNDYEWIRPAIALSPWLVLAFAAGYGLRLLQFGRPGALATPTSTPEPDPQPKPSPEPPQPLAYQTLMAQERFKSGFLARTAHELRSPINSMVGLHQLILEDLCEDPAEEREFIGQARDAAMKLLQRLDTLIAASKLDSGREHPKLAPLSVAELFRIVENLTLLQATNHNLRLTVTLPAETQSVCADGRWLRSLLVSLVEDAISNTPSGHIKLSSQSVAGDKILLCIASDRPAASLVQALDAIGQADTTPTDTNAESIATTASLPPIHLSTGLVLSIAQLMLPQMFGQLDIDSDNNGGAIVKISLPVAVAELIQA